MSIHVRGGGGVNIFIPPKRADVAKIEATVVHSSTYVMFINPPFVKKTHKIYGKIVTPLRRPRREDLAGWLNGFYG